MNILAVSGSTRHNSTNTALLNVFARNAPANVVVDVYDALANLPIFCPDLDMRPPAEVAKFRALVANADGIVISSPEYVRAIPGGLKNAIDWLVSGDAIIAKPIALLHGSHRGDDMLDALRLVLGTVSESFSATTFARFPLIGKTPQDIDTFFDDQTARTTLAEFWDDFTSLILEAG